MKGYPSASEASAKAGTSERSEQVTDRRADFEDTFDRYLDTSTPSMG
jgi:hypothetical protein